MAESGDGVGEVVCSGEFPTGVKMNGEMIMEGQLGSQILILHS